MFLFFPFSATSTDAVGFLDLYGEALHRELGTDDSTRLFTTARRKAAVNEGFNQFADLTECLIRQSTISSSHGVREYNLLSTTNIPGRDFSRLGKQRPEYHLASSGSTISVSYLSGDSFQRRDPDWLNQYEPGWRTSTAGTPCYWYERLDGGQRLLGLTPPPTIGSSESGRIVLPYVATAPVMVDDNDAPWTFTSGSAQGTRRDLYPFLEGPVHYAASQLEKLRLNYEAVDRHMQAFLAWVERYRSSVKPKGGQTIKSARNYFAEQRRKSGGSDPLPTPMSGWNY